MDNPRRRRAARHARPLSAGEVAGSLPVRTNAISDTSVETSPFLTSRKSRGSWGGARATPRTRTISVIDTAGLLHPPENSTAGRLRHGAVELERLKSAPQTAPPTRPDHLREHSPAGARRDARIGRPRWRIPAASVGMKDVADLAGGMLATAPDKHDIADHDATPVRLTVDTASGALRGGQLDAGRQCLSFVAELAKRSADAIQCLTSAHGLKRHPATHV